jgi:hypothetical protein
MPMMNLIKTSPVFKQNLLDFIPGELTMSKFFIGFVLGLMVATVGFSGIARIADNGVNKVQEISKEAAK